MKSYRNSDITPPIMQDSPVSPEWRVPRAEWDQAPWNRWTFQNVRQILPTTNVRTGAGPAQPLESDLQDFSKVSFKSVDGSRITVPEMLEATYTDGFLIYMDGRIIHESYYNGMGAATLHLAQSVSKSIVATVTGIMIGQGLLNPSELLSTYLPELKNTGWAGASLQQALDMTSGVKFVEEYTDIESDIGRTDVASGWRPIPDNALPGSYWPSCIWDQILSLKERDALHGERFYYRSIETDVIAHVMERVAGVRLAELVSQELWSPMGAEHDACFTVDSAGYALADGGFNATLRDFARFGVLHLNNGGSGTQQIIPETWVQDIRSGDHGLFNDAARQSFPNGRYRNQFWIEDVSATAVMCRGVFGQLIYISPEDSMVVVKLSSWPEFLNQKHSQNTQAALREIARVFRG
ncbi:MAG: serine hydrolase [Gammaproteobacteria bacterium]|jgi:CubicO group peptidase (beta-lactamase class C family)|nr:serine hydrolase [Gammaproteobacteria bacterium]MBT5202597.1 serine hydrolase [Gammaproteobacteria bacterium]MBT5601037.1 serine hydrolase [Gammaproteobacteria bacterium]